MLQEVVRIPAETSLVRQALWDRIVKYQVSRHFLEKFTS